MEVPQLTIYSSAFIWIIPLKPELSRLFLDNILQGGVIQKTSIDLYGYKRSTELQLTHGKHLKTDRLSMEKRPRSYPAKIRYKFCKRGWYHVKVLD